MKRLDMAGIALVLLSAWLFLSTYYYHQQAFRHDNRYAEAVTAVTSTLSSETSHDVPFMSEPRSMIDEERGILIAFITSAALAMLSILVTYLSSRRHGKRAHHLPVSFAASITAFWVLQTAYSAGLFIYAW